MCFYTLQQANEQKQNMYKHEKFACFFTSFVSFVNTKKVCLLRYSLRDVYELFVRTWTIQFIIKILPLAQSHILTIVILILYVYCTYVKCHFFPISLKCDLKLNSNLDETFPLSGKNTQFNPAPNGFPTLTQCLTSSRENQHQTP